MQKQELLEQKKGKKLPSYKIKKIDDEIKKIEREFSGMVNPYMDQALQDLKLKPNDFSLSDKVKAENLLASQKFKAQIKRSVEDSHSFINMFRGHVGVTSLKEFNYNKEVDRNKINVSVPLINEDNSVALIPNTVSQKEDNPGMTKINLNENIRDE